MLLRLLRIVTCWRFCVHLGQFCSGAMFRWPKHAIRFWHAASHSKESESQSKTVIAQQLMMTYVMTTRPGVQLYMKYWLYLSHQCWPKTRAESMNAKKYSWHEINRKLTYIPYWQRSNPLDKGTKKKSHHNLRRNGSDDEFFMCMCRPVTKLSQFSKIKLSFCFSIQINQLST